MLLAPPPILGIDKLIIIIVQTCWILPVYKIQNLLYLNIQLTTCYTMLGWKAPMIQLIELGMEMNEYTIQRRAYMIQLIL